MDFAELITPRAPGFLELMRAIHAERSDLREAFPDPNGPGMRHWMATSGVLEYPDRVASAYPPIPPQHLRNTSCGGATEQSHLYTSLEDLRNIVQIWETYADRPIDSLSSVYDFGCGCGRTLRWFPPGLPGIECIGSDVRKAAIEWCSANLEGRFLLNDFRPPLDLPDDSVELIVSLSIFSHLSLASNLAWIRELARVCRPDGLMLLSTHGAFTLAVTARSQEHQQSLHMDAAQARAYSRSLQRERFIFHPSPADFVVNLDGPEPEYGQVFFTEEFVRESWGDVVELVGYLPVGLSLIQDFFIVRPR